MKPFIKILLALLAVPSFAFSQTVINIYARVTAVTGSSITITSATGSFSAGEAFIMQMQDSTIGTNTGNNTGFGSIASIQSAGLAELVNITAASSTTITLSAAVTTNFHFNNNSRVQIVSYPTLGGGGNYTLNGGVTAPAWNGATGGVVAFKTGGTLTLNSNITVSGKGFRGGAVGNNAPADMTCDPNTFYDNAAGISTVYFGYKGEGIYNSNGVYTVAKGKLANGGGGGNINNAGGGGGSNLTAGGVGGQGWSCSLSTAGGGEGGADLSNYISGTRFFAGGGGGGGQQNNAVGTAGGNGGGIIMIKANAIQTSAGCNGGAGTVRIGATGDAAVNSGNDGAGGGGAGGSVVLQVASYSVNNACPININASGGNGGMVNNSGAHGGGAGGGKGVVIMAGVLGTPLNVSVTDTAGAGGGNDNTTGGVTAGSGSTSSSSGIGNTIFTSSSLLPVSLTGFDVTAVKSSALLQWKSATETALAYYLVERSTDNGTGYATTGKVIGKGSNAVYTFTDDVSTILLNTNRIYYRLKMVDKNGNIEYSGVHTVSFNTSATTINIKAFPNPAATVVTITSNVISYAGTVQATIHDMQGRLVKSFTHTSVTGINTATLSLDGISRGQYIITVNGSNGQEHTVITKE